MSVEEREEAKKELLKLRMESLKARLANQKRCSKAETRAWKSAE
jgi:ribosomal protein L29